MISPLLIFIRESGHFQDSLRCWRKSEKKLSMIGHKRVKQAWYEKKCNQWAQRIGIICLLCVRLYLRIWKFIKLNSSNKEINEIFWKSWKKIACKTIICCREKINHLNIKTFRALKLGKANCIFMKKNKAVFQKMKSAKWKPSVQSTFRHLRTHFNSFIFWRKYGIISVHKITSENLDSRTLSIWSTCTFRKNYSRHRKYVIYLLDKSRWRILNE